MKNIIFLALSLVSMVFADSRSPDPDIYEAGLDNSGEHFIVAAPVGLSKDGGNPALLRYFEKSFSDGVWTNYSFSMMRIVDRSTRIVKYTVELTQFNELEEFIESEVPSAGHLVAKVEIDNQFVSRLYGKWIDVIKDARFGGKRAIFDGGVVYISVYDALNGYMSAYRQDYYVGEKGEELRGLAEEARMYIIEKSKSDKNKRKGLKKGSNAKDKD